MNATLLSGLFTRIVIDYSSTSVHFIYLRRLCLDVYMYVFYGIVITCVLSCDSMKKFDDDDDDDAVIMQDGPFAWPKEIQGHILGSFFIGYTISQIPAGLMAERLGAKWVLFGFLGASTLATLLTPAAAWLGYGAVIAARIVSGVGSVSL